MEISEYDQRKLGLVPSEVVDLIYRRVGTNLVSDFLLGHLDVGLLNYIYLEEYGGKRCINFSPLSRFLSVKLRGNKEMVAALASELNVNMLTIGDFYSFRWKNYFVSSSDDYLIINAFIKKLDTNLTDFINNVYELSLKETEVA